MEESEQDPNVHRILIGNLGQHNLPQIPQRVVRVYINSGGIDSQTERNAFVERVYPKLREYCRQRYGIEFQIVDLEWGIGRLDSILYTQNEKLRAREQKKCRDLSMGPCFVAFIGQKYGEYTLPTAIPVDEYETLRIALMSQKRREARSALLLDEWYTRDENAISAAYVLANITEKLPDLTSLDESKRVCARAKWLEVKEEMSRMFLKAADFSYYECLLDGDTVQKYLLSEQDFTVRHCTEESGSPRDRCLLITRNIVDLKNYVDDPKVCDFAEVHVNNRTDLKELDSACASKLKKLEAHIKQQLPTRNILIYDVLWRYEDVIDPELHAAYLNKICAEFHDILKTLIDESVPNVNFNVEPDIYLETLQHWIYCKKKATIFFGQDEIVKKLHRYLKHGNTNKPFVLYGEPGSGKTTLLSAFALEVATDSSIPTFCAVRYIGFTPKCSDLKQLMMTLICQLLYTLGRPTNDLPYEIEDLLRYFNELLTAVSMDFKVIIFLDGLEKISPEYNAHSMSWLPTVLNSRIKIILSTHSKKHNILDTLMNDIINDADLFLEVTELPPADSERLLHYILGLYGRKLTPLQLNVFQNAFKECSIPMFVHLISHKARTLSSNSTCEQQDIPANVSEAIQWMFDSLEVKHGKVFVGRAFGYLVASVTGLSDCEMEDILSLDEDVLNAVYTKYHPPVRRIPYIKWLSLKNDIEQFLVFRDADGVTVYLWCHDEFENAVRKRYLNEEVIVQNVHSMLADYFLGTWAGKKKPVIVSNQTASLPRGLKADRLVLAQPLTFEVQGSPIRYNKRKLDQVPRHLHLSMRLEELNSVVLFNYEWIYNKIKAFSLTHILSDFVLNLGEESTLVEQSLRVAESTIQCNINNLAPEISGHLLPYYKTHQNIRALINQCDTVGLKHCALIPNFSYLLVPGSSLQYTIPLPVCGDFYRLTDSSRCLLVKMKESSVVYRYDIVTGEEKGSVFASNGDLYLTPDGKRFVIVDHVTEKAIKVHDSESGHFFGQLIVMNHIQLKAKTKYKLDSVCLTDERMAVIVTTDISYLCIADLRECHFLQITSLAGKCDILEIAPNGRNVFCNSNEFLLCYNMYTLQHMCTVAAGYRPCAIAFTGDGFRAYLAKSIEPTLLVMHLHRGVVEIAYRLPLENSMHDDKIVCLKISPKDDMLLIRGSNNLVVFNRFSERVCAKFARPDDVPREFRLPKSSYTELYYTNADFSRDGSFVIATIFRHVYIFQISTGARIATIQAPVGIISDALVSLKRNQVITHLLGSNEIQIWNIDKALNQVNMLDKLTSEIEEIKLNSDDSLAYFRCKDSDELGIIDMCSGVMLDLLTHDSNVCDFTTTPNGQYLLVSCVPKRKNSAVKIWNLDERKIIEEFGNTTGYYMGAHKSETIICVAQEELDLNAPFFIKKLSFTTSGVLENTHPLSLRYILDSPFLTNFDEYVVVLTAQDYIDSKAMFDTPTICVFSFDEHFKVSYYTPESFVEAVYIDEIKKVSQSSQNSHTLMVLYTINAAVVDMNDYMTGKASNQLGLLVLDINSGAIITVCEPFLSPGIPISSLTFYDVQFCIDSEYRLFDIGRMSYVGCLPNPGIPPRVICLHGNAVIYYKDTQIFVISISSSKIIAICETHAKISRLKICSDDRTIIVGCVDGTIASYVLIDPDIDDPEIIVASLSSRFLVDVMKNGRSSRNWDRVESPDCPAYSRPHIAVNTEPNEQILLQRVKPAPKIRPSSDTLIYLNERSKTCVLQ